MNHDETRDIESQVQEGLTVVHSLMKVLEAFTNAVNHTIKPQCERPAEEARDAIDHIAAYQWDALTLDAKEAKNKAENLFGV